MSDPIRQWLPRFLQRHRARYGPGDWPDPRSDEWAEFIKVWYETFLALRVSEDEADRASRRLGAHPPQWQREHIPAVMREVEAIRRENFEAVEPDSRAEAEQRSRECPKCDGRGLVTLYHPSYDGSPTAPYRLLDGSIVRGPSTVTGHCTCVLGRWMRKRTDPDLQRRMPDLADIEAGRSRWRLADPILEPEAHR